MITSQLTDDKLASIWQLKAISMVSIRHLVDAKQISFWHLIDIY